MQMKPAKTTPHAKNVQINFWNHWLVFKPWVIVLAKLSCFFAALGGWFFFACCFMIRLAIWRARHIPGTRASMVPMKNHIIGFVITLGPCLFFMLVTIASWLWLMNVLSLKDCETPGTQGVRSLDDDKTKKDAPP